MKPNILIILIFLAISSSAFGEEYELRVTSEKAPLSVPFRGVIGHDNQLEIIESSTPYSTVIDASRITAMFESVDSSQPLLVELIGELEGEIKVIASFGGSAGRIIEEPGLRKVSNFEVGHNKSFKYAPTGPDALTRSRLVKTLCSKE